MADPPDFPVAAIGASAGGLEAFRTLLAALPDDTGMAFILVQHLDPLHASMMVSLLTGHTRMKVHEAGDGMRLEPDNVYVIPPGRYLTVRDGALHLSPVEAGGGARMPFDFLLQSLADESGKRAVCAILSGTGSDGGLGAKAIRRKGGLAIAQEPNEAAFDGMPRSAIATGAVDLVLPLTRLAEALVTFAKRGKVEGQAGALPLERTAYDKIIELLYQRTAHDFRVHKRGSLMRRLERRMALANTDDPEKYLALLEADQAEVQHLVDDLFINVTSFFRDAAAFNLLETSVIPELVREQPVDRAIRVWVAGCSTGEEAYSLAILFSEAIEKARRNIKLQVFASDIDDDAIAFAREGLYPHTIEQNVTALRLARFFAKEDHGYRVTRNLRDTIVFSVHDLLSDAPFSRMDFVSCRNVLIYLEPDVQQQVLGLFHFALRQSGVLFLGSAGSISESIERFEPISLKERIFRHIARSRPGEVEMPLGRAGLTRAVWHPAIPRGPVRRPGVGDLAQRLLLETYAPVSVLVNAKEEGVYYFGRVDRYLRFPEGEPNLGVLAASREGLRSALRTAMEKAKHDQARAVATAARVQRNGATARVTVTAQPVQSDGEEMLLVSFVDEPEAQDQQAAATPEIAPAPSDESARIVELERELEAARKDLDDAAHERQIAEEELKAINEEAMSLNEEFQTTNEELQTSKEELQSLNEELSTLNAQLQETVEREHATADDLHNILTSSDVGTLFLDEGLNIRFFTPPAKPLFNLIPSDIGRPLADLARHFTDDKLIEDAGTVLASLTPIAREVLTDHGTWHIRRISPYRTRENKIQGVVITFVDISEVKAAERAAAAARAYAESILGEIRGPLLVLDEELRVVSASRSFYRLFETDAAQTVGRTVAAIDARHLDVPQLSRFLELLRADAAAVEDYEMEIDLPKLGRRTLILNTVDIPQEPGTTRKILVAIEDVTARKLAQTALMDAKQTAETANISKSRFLAAASHDLRQPLQTLHLLQSMLARKVEDKEAAQLVARIDDSLRAMTGMMDTLLDISQIEAGVIKPEMSVFPIANLLERLRSEFSYHTEAHGLGWRVVPSGLMVRSDRRLLEQMLRNLLTNAVKYTSKGKILIGCRRRGDSLRIEVWDTGIGMPEESLKAIFEEYHQLANPARQLSLGLGLGLAIVQRLGDLLGHAIDVRSQVGRGSVFAITVPVERVAAATEASRAVALASKGAGRGGAVLIVEDDPAVRDSLEMLLQAEGYSIASAANGEEALAIAARHDFAPDIAIVDYNLPGGRSGVEVATRLRQALGGELAVMVLTGDISSATVEQVARHGFLHCNKPLPGDDLLVLLATVRAKQQR